MAKKEKIKEEESSITPVSTPPENTESQVGEPRSIGTPGRTFGQVLRRFFLILLRSILILALVAGIAAAAYFGLPLLYDRFIRPVEQNTSQLLDLEAGQSRSETQVADLQTRIAPLEAGQPDQAESITQMDARIQTLESAGSKRNDEIAELTYESDLLRAMELLSRARLFLYQSNFGLARQDVQAARDILAGMQTTVPESKQAAVRSALFRLDLVLENLPDFPVAASSDLDIAWQILVQGIPFAPSATPTSTPTATPAAQDTPSPELTSTPTATP